MKTLFPLHLPERQWLEFSAEGYRLPVSGAIFTSKNPPCCGMPLGSLGTGCIDLDARGVLGFSSLFNPYSNHLAWENWIMPRKAPKIEPFLGVSIGEKTWVLCSPELVTGGDLLWCTEPQMFEAQGKPLIKMQAKTSKIEGVNFPENISYWGHFPLADMEYDLQAPVSIGLRSWSPFIPGDLPASNTPAAVFEVHLRNNTDDVVAGRLAFSFQGPDEQESKGEFLRSAVNEPFLGSWVRSTGGVEYVVGVIKNPENLTVCQGTRLGKTSQGWKNMSASLPLADHYIRNGVELSKEGSASLAVDFKLLENEEQIIRFFLTWYAPVIEGVTHHWEGNDVVGDGHLRLTWVGSPWQGPTHTFTHMYASRYNSALEVAAWLVENHQQLLQKVVAWQEVIYQAEGIPFWLKDSLINNLCLIAEDSYWFQAKAPLDASLFPLGAFAMNESPRGCPHMSCTPCDWYGNLPIVYFFPELARSNLRLFRLYQRENGEIPFALGKIADKPDMATPEYYWQVSLNGMCYIDMVDRLWQRTGDASVVEEFYDSVKKCNSFMMDLKKGPGGPISFPEIGGMEWFEFGEWAGMASHLGGLRLAQLRMVARMAEAAGDQETVIACEHWYNEGSRAMEEELWTGEYYLNYLDKETGRKSDDVMAYQLDGEWAARFHGLPGVFRSERVKITLDTVQRCNIALTPNVGAANFCRPDGSALGKESPVAYYGTYAMFPPELVMLGMNYILAGEHRYGQELVEKHWQTICLSHGHAWDVPNIISGDDGRRMFGTDYYQLMMLWALPAAILGQNLTAFTGPGSLVEQILQASTRT